MTTTVFDLTCCPSAFVPESELSHNVEAHHGLVPKLVHHEWKNPASLKNHSFQYVAVIGGVGAAGFLGFSSEDVFSCAATSDVVRACAGACSQAQSHDVSTKAQSAKTSAEGFFRFLLTSETCKE